MTAPADITLHIGGHKTGTSSIQAALTASKDLLWQNGKVLYPESGFGKINHITLAHEFTKKHGDHGHGNLEKLKAEINLKRPNSALLSAEAFETADENLVSGMFKEAFADSHSVGVIFYIRSPASLILSQFDQRMMNVWTALDFGPHINRMKSRYGFPTRLRNWDEAFDGRILVRPFSRAELVNGNVVEDFFVHMFGDDHPATRFAAELPAQNIGRPASLVLMMESCKAYAKDPRNGFDLKTPTETGAYMKCLNRVLKDICKDDRSKLRWPGKELRDFHRVALKGVRSIDSRYFGRPILERDLEKLIDKTPAETGKLTLEEVFGKDETEIQAMVKDAADQALQKTKFFMRRRKKKLSESG